MLVCTICGGSGWKIVHKQGDLVDPEGVLELQKQGLIVIPCYYACTTYVTCDCRIFKIQSDLIRWDTPDLNRTTFSGPVYQTGGFHQAPSCPSVFW